MKLTEAEVKHFENIKGYQRNLYRMRYFFAIMGAILIGIAFIPVLYYWFQGNMTLVNKLISHPIIYLLPIFGGGSISYAVQGWKGHSVYVLLTRVIEEIREE